MKQVQTFFLLFLSLVCGATLHAQQTENVGYFRIQTNYVPAFVLDNGGKVMTRTTSADAHPNTGEVGNLSEIWQIQAKATGGYTIMNVASGKMVVTPGGLEQPHTTQTVGTTYYIKTVDKNLRVISSRADFSDKYCWHRNNNVMMVRWSEDENSKWRFFPITDPTDQAAIANAPAIRAAVAAVGNNRVFSIKNQNGLYLSQGTGNNLILTATPQNTSQAHLWILENAGNKYIIRNAQTLKTLLVNTAGVTTSATGTGYIYIKQSAIDSHVTLSSGAAFANRTCIAASSNNDRVELGNASTSALTASDWVLEPSSRRFEEVMNIAYAATGQVYTPVHGQYYRLVNKAHVNRSMTGILGANTLEGTVTSSSNHGQIWMLEGGGNTWALKNVLTEQYIGNDGARSEDFKTGTSKSNFTLQRPDEFNSAVAFQGQSFALHCAQSQNFRIVGWFADNNESQWYLQPVEMTDSLQQAIRDTRSFIGDLHNNKAAYNQKMQKFFTDATYSQLKDNYASMTTEEFRTTLQAEGLHAALFDIAMRVKTDTWNPNNVAANRLEKGFRIAEYAPHSNEDVWYRRLGMDFMFSRLVNPTGITGNAGEVIFVFVEQAPPNCTVKAEVVSGFAVSGRQYDLTPGINAIQLAQKSHIYVYYTLNEPSIKLADRPAIKVHIEGGRANGYIDAARHTNEDWRTMRNLESEGFFQDGEIRLKARNHTNYVMHRGGNGSRGLYELDNNDEWIYNGTDYGIIGLLDLHQEHIQASRDLAGLSEYSEYFNCRYTAMSSADGNPHATSFGTYYPGVGNYMSFAKFTKGWENDEGAPIWVWAHENGHLFQGPVNFAGMTEVSVNLFSQVSAWKRGSSVTRGVPLKSAITKFHAKAFYADYGGSELMRMYWQLYLYYEVLGHHPGFYTKVFNRLRADRMTRSVNPNSPQSGWNNYLKFARICSEVAQEDLSEFFEFYGFFIPVTNRTVGDYSNTYFTTPLQDINRTKALMERYPVKRKNLLFIDDRIELEQATHRDAQPGEMKHASSYVATPGVASEVGDVGMYTAFAKNAPSVAVTAVRQVERTFQLKTTNAVGYKVYDGTGQLVFVSNEHTFTIPTNIDINRITIKVGGGDGQEIEVVQNGQILQQYNVPAVFSYRHGLDVAADVDAIITEYTIHNPELNKSLTTNTLPTESNVARFAIVAGSIGEGVYIYNIEQSKWLSYNSTTDGPSKVVLVADKAQAKMWAIQPENGEKTRFDVFPYSATTGITGNSGWNWHGGIKQPNPLGFFDVDDRYSVWTFIPTHSTNSIGSATKDADGSGEVYDLSGRRVEKTQPGKVYVRNGQVFIAR